MAIILPLWSREISVFFGKRAVISARLFYSLPDIVDCIKHISARKYLFWEDSDGSNVIPYDESVTAMYVRATGDIHVVENIFGAVMPLTRKNMPKEEIAFTTQPMTIKIFNEKVKQATENGLNIINTIRVADF